jgi:Spy/CpxP family protein refolding chaperone
LFARITLLIVVMSALCAAAFSIGGASRSQDRGYAFEDVLGDHPVSIALRFHQELGLSDDQVQHLQHLREELTNAFAPFKDRAEAIHRQMEEFQRGGGKDPQAAQALQHQAEELQTQLKPIFEHFGQAVGEILTPEQREKLGQMNQAHSHADGDPFLLMFLMEARERLGVTPQQFTKLQFLQADFIRAFAPIREQVEMTMMEVQEKYAKAGKEPPQEIRHRMEGLQQKVKELQTQFSERAVKDVLQPEQRARLQEIMHGDHAGHGGG